MREPVMLFALALHLAAALTFLALAAIDRIRGRVRINALTAEAARLAIGLRCVEAACDRGESHARIRRIAERALHPLLGYEKDKPNG